MIPRRALISLLVVVMFSATLGCAGRSEQGTYQEITVPESPQDVNVEGTEETEPETMAEEEEEESTEEATTEETSAEETEPEPAEEEMAEAQPQEEAPPEPDEEQAEPAPEEDAEPEPATEEAPREETEETAMEEEPAPEEDMGEETQEAPAEAATAEPAEPTPPDRPRPETIEADEALAIVYPTRGHRMGGWVHFREVEGGVRVLAKFKGLEPNQKHGFHLHEYGDFGDRDGGLTAGGHYDPQNTGRHGRPNAEEPHHAGDLGNLEANADGVAGYDRVIKGISVAGGPNPVLGRAVVVHTQPDDFSQPSGNAGPRLAVGVIGVANPD